jgi:hypothetical protein
VARSEESKSRIQRIREKLAETNLGGGGFWKPKVGSNRIRILPEVGEMDVCWVNVGQHYISQNNRHFCRSFTLDDACPICELVNELYTAGDDASKEMASDFRVTKQFWMNVIDRDNEERGVQIFTPGVMIFRQIGEGLLLDPEYGDLIFDPDEGLDLIIKRTGQQMQTRYDVIPTRELTPLHADPNQAEQWLNSAKDLSPVDLSEDGADVTAPVVVETYERLQAVLEGIAGVEEDTTQLDEDTPFFEEEPAEEEDDDAAKIDRRISSTRASAARRRRTRR